MPWRHPTAPPGSRKAPPLAAENLKQNVLLGACLRAGDRPRRGELPEMHLRSHFES